MLFSNFNIQKQMDDQEEFSQNCLKKNEFREGNPMKQQQIEEDSVEQKLQQILEYMYKETKVLYPFAKNITRLYISITAIPEILLFKSLIQKQELTTIRKINFLLKIQQPFVQRNLAKSMSQLIIDINEIYNRKKDKQKQLPNTISKEVKIQANYQIEPMMAESSSKIPQNKNLKIQKTQFPKRIQRQDNDETVISKQETFFTRLSFFLSSFVSAKPPSTTIRTNTPRNSNQSKNLTDHSADNKSLPQVSQKIIQQSNPKKGHQIHTKVIQNKTNQISHLMRPYDSWQYNSQPTMCLQQTLQHSDGFVQHYYKSGLSSSTTQGSIIYEVLDNFIKTSVVDGQKIKKWATHMQQKEEEQESLLP